MITILKGKDITVEWKVVSLETKQPTVFISNETHVFLIAPNDIYTLPFEVVREDFCGLRVTIPTAYLTTGVYDLKVIWLKDVMRESLVNKLEYRNASIKREVFSLTDDVSEVTYEGEIIKIVSGAETFGRDGMSAYEIAAFRGVLPKGMSEAEWANQENVRQQNEAKRESAEDERITAEAARQQNELRRESQESVRTETFNAKERSREQAFDDAQSRRDAEFQRSEASRSNTFAANEQTRQQSFEANETSRQHQEAARVIAEGARVTAEALRKQAEEARENVFATNEQTRQTTFEDNEERREDAFDEAIQAAKDNLVVVNDLTTGGGNKALSAEMGKTLYDKLRLSSSLYINSQGPVEVKVDERTIRSTYYGLERAPLKLRQDYYSENPDILLNGGLVADEYSYNFPALKVGTVDDTIEVEFNGIKVSSSVIKKLDETNTLALKLSSDIDGYATKESVEEVKRGLTEAIEQIEEDKVDRDDNAPKLTAGFANNLVGRGEATDEEISFRPSGGDTSIEDGTARIERLRGNTVVWNQCIRITVVTAMYDNTLYTFNLSNGLVTVAKSEGGTTSSDSIFCYFRHQFIASRKYLLVYNLKRNDGQNSSHRIGGFGIYDGTKYHNIPDVAGDYKFFSPTESFTSERIQIVQSVTAGVALSYTLRPVIYDLTQMFGAGNEPTTIEEFNARKPLGIDEYAYNEGELISTNVDEVKSVGFNILDVSAMQPNRILSNGNVLVDASVVHSDYTKVLPSSTYFTNIYCKNNVYTLVWFDENKAVISGSLGSLVSNTGMSVTSPSNAAYVVINLLSDNYDSSNFVFHLKHTGYRNGEYEPYKEFRRSIPISEIKDSDGNQFFPNGLLSAGSVYDEITATKAIKRIGVVDMGTLNWSYPPNTPSTSLFSGRGVNDRKVDKKFNAMSSLYDIGGWMGGTPPESKLIDKTIYPHYNATNYSTVLYAFNLSYTDPVLFAQAMSGVMLYYELAEPIEVDLPEPLNLDYEVSDFGTEEVISDVPTTPLKADIIYQFNAVDRIRDNSRHTAEAAELLDAKADKTTVEVIQKNELQLSVKDNGNIVLSNANGVSKEFMPATPSGDPMHYAYIAAGAEWNDTDQIIQKTAPWGDTVEHLPKHYYLNGLGDITEEQMMRIYDAGRIVSTTPIAQYRNSSIRTNIVAVLSGTEGRTLSMYYLCNGARKMQVFNNTSNGATKVNSIHAAFSSCTLLKYIIPIINVSAATSADDMNPAFSNCSSLILCRISNLKYPLTFSSSPLISKESILYTIQNASPSSAITITLHADAYALLAEDADIVAALEEKNAALAAEGTGGSISLVSA